MLPWLEFEDKSIEKAISRACEELNVPKDNASRSEGAVAPIHQQRDYTSNTHPPKVIVIRTGHQ